MSRYLDMTRDANAHMVVLIDTNLPIKLADFVPAFTPIENHYKSYTTDGDTIVCRITVIEP